MFGLSKDSHLGGGNGRVHRDTKGIRVHAASASVWYRYRWAVHHTGRGLDRGKVDQMREGSTGGRGVRGRDGSQFRPGERQKEKRNREKQGLKIQLHIKKINQNLFSLFICLFVCSNQGK